MILQYLLLICSEFKELEPAPSMAVMEGPLEPSPASNKMNDVTDSTSFSNFFNVRIALTKFFCRMSISIFFFTMLLII